MIAPLYGAYRVLLAAREKRGALDLDLPERLVRLGDDGRIAEIGVRERLDSHKLIEEFMVLANVAAAQALEQRQAPCLYRVHDNPDPAKLAAYGMGLVQLAEALEHANRIAGAGYVSRSGEAYVVRADARLRTLDELAQTPVVMH